MNTNPDPNDDHRELIFRATLLVGLIILILVIAFTVAAFSCSYSYSIEDNYKMEYKKYKKEKVPSESISAIFARDQITNSTNEIDQMFTYLDYLAESIVDEFLNRLREEETVSTISEFLKTLERND